MSEAAHLHRRAMAGIALAIGAYCCYPAGDAMVKAIATQYPGTGISALRYVFSTIVLGIASFLYDRHAFFTFPRPWLQIGRGAAVSISTATFFVALGSLPLAEATVIMYLSPIIIVVLSRVFLGEHVPSIAWVATLLAFAGVVIVVRPDPSGMNWVALLPLVTAFTMASFVILTRMAVGSGSVLHSQFLISLMALLISSIIAVAGHFTGISRLHLSLPSTHVLIGCAVVATTATTAHGLLIMAADRVSASRIAPFAYVQMLVAVVLGALFFGDWPDWITGIGAGLIIVAGVLTLQAQRRVARAMVEAAVAE